MKIAWDTVVAAAKRENNSRRSFVVVNRWQGKHVPVSPTVALRLFDTLAVQLKQRYGQGCLAVGFAETATAIGLQVAHSCGWASMTTTREAIPDVRYLYFSEVHSHATEQKLVRDDLDCLSATVRRIVFVEDEITTGNTILQIVALLRQTYGADRFAFTAASILNGMDAIDAARFAQAGIDCVYLYKTDAAHYDVQIRQYHQPGQRWNVTQQATLTEEPFCYDGQLQLRRLQCAADIDRQCTALGEYLQKQFAPQPGERLLLLGTEEFMYPALAAGAQLERTGCQVWCHATTRSPIVPMEDVGYPLQQRWQMMSLYDAQRTTYLYNLREYDQVIVLSDAPLANNAGLSALAAALRAVGNQRIHAVEWRHL